MRTNSGLNFTNISGGMAGASQALQQGYDWRMRQQMEEMRDARAENLQRFTLQKQLEHEDWRSQLSATTQKEIAERQGAIETSRELASQKLHDQESDEFWKRTQAAQTARETQEREENEARGKIESSRQMQENVNQMILLAQSRDAAMTRLSQELNQAVDRNPSLSMITDPVAKQRALANDPTIHPILDAIDQVKTGYAKNQAILVLEAGRLGNPNFQGVKLPAMPQASDSLTVNPDLIANPLGAPSSILGAPQNSARPGRGDATSTASPSANLTPDNPRAGADAPVYPSNPEADNAPAIDRPPPGSPPGSSPAGMPPTIGYMRPPVTTLVGPARTAPQLIPTLPAMNFGSTAPQGAAPQLIQTP